MESRKLSDVSNSKQICSSSGTKEHVHVSLQPLKYMDLIGSSQSTEKLRLSDQDEYVSTVVANIWLIITNKSSTRCRVIIQELNFQLRLPL